MSELAFEGFYVALETVRGTAVTPPTNRLNVTGTIEPQQAVYRPPDQLGTLAEFSRSEIIRRWATIAGDGALDVYQLPLLLNMIMGPKTTPVKAGGQVTGFTGITGGTGYTTAPTVTLGAPAAGGVQATAHATVSAGAVNAVIVDNPGRGYAAAPTVTFGGPGSGAAATATVSAQATIAQYWDFYRVMTADTIKSATAYWGDPNVRMFQSPWAMLDELKMAGDSTGTDGATMSITGTGQFPTDLAAPTLPADAVGPLIVPKKMQVYLDVANAIGTTLLTGRVLSAEHTLQSGVTYKYEASGPAGGVTYVNTGRMKTHPETKVKFEFADNAQWLNFSNGDNVKLRVRHNGNQIEAGYYYGVEVDMYGKLDAPAWGDLEGSNRTIEFTVMGEYNATIGTDARVGVISDKATL